MDPQMELLPTHPLPVPFLAMTDLDWILLGEDAEGSPTELDSLYTPSSAALCYYEEVD